MRNVNRPATPESLEKNGGRWTKALLDHIDECRRTGNKPKEIFFDRYRRDDILNALRIMYNGTCCFCESRIGAASYYQIEHRKPKRRYPKETYEWDNLHLCCAICNTNKGEKFDRINQILDAATDRPITDHYDYKEGYWMPETLRGETTEDHVKLNRKVLFKTRSIIFLKAMSVVADIKKSAGHPKIGVVTSQLDDMCDGEFGSVFRWVKHIFLA